MQMGGIRSIRSLAKSADRLVARPDDSATSAAGSLLPHARGRKFHESGRSDYHRDYVNGPKHIEVSAGWDPDHEHVHVTARFHPVKAIVKQPFRDEKLPEKNFLKKGWFG